MLYDGIGFKTRLISCFLLPCITALRKLFDNFLFSRLLQVTPDANGNVLLEDANVDDVSSIRITPVNPTGPSPQIKDLRIKACLKPSAYTLALAFPEGVVNMKSQSARNWQLNTLLLIKLFMIL